MSSSSGKRCRMKDCKKECHINKEFCLDHYKDQDSYTYGLDADIEKKLSDKFDPQKETEAKAWLEELTGDQCGSDQTVQEWLKSGVVLCNAINAISPGSIKAINKPGKAFTERENVVSFTSACKKLGMAETDIFVTGDLYENTNMVIVIDCIHSLGAVSRKVKGFKGPYLGVKLADENKRDFSDKKPEYVPSKQTSGSYGYQVERDTGLDKIIKNVNELESNQGKNNSSSSSSSTSSSTSSSSKKKDDSSSKKDTSSSSSSSKGANFCAKDGTKREGDAKFCSKCGEKF